jgi:hypothetical protein
MSEATADPACMKRAMAKAAAAFVRPDPSVRAMNVLAMTNGLACAFADIVVSISAAADVRNAVLPLQGQV